MSRREYKISNYEIREIDSKLGIIEINPETAICFPRGIVGFGNKHYYCLIEVPENKLPGALLLQSVEEDKLGFIVLPLASQFYAKEGGLLMCSDVVEAANSYKIASENLDLLVIATLTKINDQFKMSINLKAPIFLNKAEKIAYQHVFIRHDYPLTYYLS